MTGTSRGSSPTPHPQAFRRLSQRVICLYSGCKGIKHMGQFQAGQEDREVGTFLCVHWTAGQTVYRMALPRVCLWYAGYAMWITGCKIPSKEASWSQQCEAKLIRKKMTCWQPQCDQQHY